MKADLTVGIVNGYESGGKKSSAETTDGFGHQPRIDSFQGFWNLGQLDS